MSPVEPLVREVTEERLRPAHEHLVELVDAAESLGYGIAAVSTGSITLAPPGTRDIELTISGRLVTGDTLVRLLRPIGSKA